jgi:exopolyphosphatase/guanosine-5'-triphosphate,3'-diphosphate pyrophosphatase
MGGMAKKEILPEAKERAVAALSSFARDLRDLGMEASEAEVYATSAFRNARNATEVLAEIEARTGFKARIISGEEEASLIFKGVLGSGALSEGENSLVVDIGGGSVEFILCQGENPVWKQSFETGGLRLMERFHITDPMPSKAREELELHLREVLSPIWEQTKDIKNLNLIGCSGSFDTLVDMRNARLEPACSAADNEALHFLDPSEFHEICQSLLPLPIEERLAIPGMIPLRAGMMVVALILIRVLLEETGAGQIRVSTYALKEGALFQQFQHA